MQRTPLLSVLLCASVLLAAGLGPAMAAAADDARKPGETVYLDPDTGDVIDPPADRAAIRSGAHRVRGTPHCPFWPRRARPGPDSAR